jgi:hypothetical protein
MPAAKKSNAKAPASLQEIKTECFGLEEANEEYWEPFEGWLSKVETAWKAAGSESRKQKKVGRDLIGKFNDVACGEIGYHSKFKFHFLSAVAEIKPNASNVLWQIIRRGLHSHFDSKPIRLWAADPWHVDRFLPLLWKSIKSEVAGGEWVDLRDDDPQIKTTSMLVALVRVQIAQVGVTVSTWKLLQDIHAEAKAFKRTKVMAELAQELESVTEGLADPSSEWLEWCGRAVKSTTPKPTRDCFPMAPYAFPIVIHEEERLRLETVIADCAKCAKRNNTSPLVKGWLQHLSSSKCIDEPGRLLNYLILRRWVVDGYRMASGEDRLTPDHRSTPISMLEKGLRELAEAGLRKKFTFQPEDFDVFVGLLYTIRFEISMFVPIISRCEEFAEAQAMSIRHLELIGRFYNVVDPDFSQEGERSLKRWTVLEKKQKRRAR